MNLFKSLLASFCAFFFFALLASGYVDISPRELAIDKVSISKRPLAYVIGNQEKGILPVDAKGLGSECTPLGFKAKLMATSFDGTSAYMVEKDSGLLLEVDLAAGTERFIKAPKGNIRRLVISGNGQFAYACYENRSEIFRLDLENAEYDALTHFKNAPENILLDITRDRLYVIVQDSLELQTVDLKTGVQHSLLTLEAHPDAMVLSSTGENLYLFQQASGLLTDVNVASKSLDTRSYETENIAHFAGKRIELGLDSKENKLYLGAEAGSKILKLDLNTHKIETLLETDFPIECIRFCTESAPEGDLIATDPVSRRAHFEALDAGPIIAKAPSVATTSVVVSSANPSTFQQSVTFTATVSIVGGATTPVPTGTFTFMDGASTLGTVNLTGFSAAYTLSTFSVGTHSITVIYNGDSLYLPSTSPPVSQVVNQATTTTNLVSNPSSSVFGQSVLLTATITPANSGSTIPTGTVTFKDGATTIGTSALSGGVATLSTSSLSVSTHSLTAVYNGDTNFITSTSNAVSQVVAKASTSTALTSSVNPTVFGNSTLLTATISVTSGAGTPSGTVTFKNGSTTIGTGTISGTTAILSISNLGVGSNALTAVYNGDGNFNTSTSNTVTQVVNQGTTTSTLTSSVPTTTYGASTTFTATVAVATGTGTPTGYFTFMDGATTLGTVNLTGLSATLSISTLSVGTHSITAIYSGDTNFQTSTSTPALSQVVNKAIPVITLTPSPTSSSYSDIVTFTSSVTSPTSLGLPSGTVTFFDGATSLGSVTLVASGANSATASLPVSTLSGGTHSITAVFSGDANFVTVTSSPALAYVVSPLTTTTTLYSGSVNATVYGESVILLANVTGSVSSPPLPPSGTVTFFDGSTAIGTVSLVAGLSPSTSTATLTYSAFSIGSHTLKAVYNADSNYTTSTSPNLTRSVIKAATTNVVTTSGTPSVVGQNVTFTTTITPNSPGAGIPTGTINFYNGTMLLGSGTLSAVGANSSQATLSVSSLTLGNHFIFTTYAGDTNFTSSTSSTITQLVNKDSTTTVFSSSLPTSNFGDSVTWTATVTANAPGSGVPTGTVSFFNGSTLMGTGTLNGSGVATYSSIALYPGSYTLKATYQGDSNYISSTSANFTQTVINKLNTVTTVSSSRNSSPVATAVTYSATVTAITGIPTGTVSFFDGGVPIGTGTINGSGVATLTVPGTSLLVAPLTHVITATYGGDANFITSNSLPYNQYIVPYNTTTVLAVTPNHSEQANALLTATVTPSGLPLPIPILAGTVTFYEGNTAISPALAVPANGIVTFSPNNLHFNARTLVAVYSGNQLQFATSTSNTVNQQVQQTDMLTTSTVVTTSQSTTYLCQSVNFSATVTQTQGFYTPTGTVTFYDGTTSLGSAILNSSGVATLPVSTLSLGTHNISATYNSDSNYAFSSSNSFVQTVVVNPTTTTLQVIPNLVSTPYGQSLVFVATVQAAFGTPTGHVTFTDENGNVLSVVDVDSTGMATYTDAMMTGGAHTVTAGYSSACCSFETGCYGGSSASLDHTIILVNPKLTLVATPSPGTYGNTVRLTATADAYLSGTPTGKVSFYLGSTFLGTSAISEGVANLTVSNLNAGLNLFNATYSGDSNFLPANFPSYLETINKANVTVALSSTSANPSQYGQPVTLNAEVISLISVPTGTVSFFWGSTLLSKVAVDANGNAAFTSSTLPIGANAITAVYNGDSNFNTATSSAFTQTVAKGTTTTTITSSSPTSSTFNTPVTFNVAVAGTYSGASVPTGTVTGYFGSTVLGTATLSGGVASFVTSVLPAGVDTITVVYGGDSNFFGSTGLGTQTVNVAVTTVSALTTSQTPSVFGQAVTFSATVSSTAGIPAGTVTFYDGTTQIGTGTLNSSGVAAFTTAALSVATHTIRATYSGSSSFATSTQTLSQPVNKAATTTALNSNISTSAFGQAVTFTATVTPTSPGAGIPTGTITFRNGATTLGTVNLNNGGTATFTTSSLVASGTAYSITAVYAGDTNFTTSTSSALSQTVNPVSTVIVANSSANPSALGQNITFNVSVTAVNTGAVTPIGTVTATYGSTVIGTGSLSASGTISFSTATLPAGTLPILFTYAGNSNFAASSTTLVQTVVPGGSTTTLIASPNPSFVGQSVTFTSTVSSASGTPTGTVSFFDGTGLIGTQTLNTGGTATLSASTLTLGAHTITAVYSGDSSRATSTSPIVIQTVQQAPTATVVTSSVNPTQFGQATMFSATVSITSGSGTPTGTVAFYNNGVLLGTRGVSGNLATLTTSTLTQGPHTITAIYSGDTNFATSTSAGLTQNVAKADTTTTVTATPNPSTLGTTVAFTATVQVTTGSGTPTGSVTFKDGATVLGSAALSGNQATFNTSALTLGSHSITATYNGDSNYNVSVSTALSEVINQGNTTTSLTSNINPSGFGQAINLIATVNVGASSILPTGTVTFFDGPISLGSATLSGNTATFSISTLGVTSHSLTAVYSGDTNYTTSTSPFYLQLVNAANTTTTVSSSLNPALFGTTVTFTSNVTSQSGTGIPTGLVSFREGTTILGSATLVGGTATFSTNSLSSGGHSISAIYLGNSNFLTSTSTSFTQTIEQGTTSTALTSSVNPSGFGQATTLTATVTVSTGVGTPTGTVTFLEGTRTIGTSILSTVSLLSGVATLDVSDLPVGSHAITAIYNGDDNFTDSTSPPVTQVVTQAASSIHILSTTPNPSMFGQNVTFFATVSTLTSDATGTVTFFDEATSLGTVAVFNGLAIFDTPLLSIGTHSITAHYNGDTQYAPSTSTAVSQTVNQTSITQTTAIQLTSSLNPSTFGQTVEFDLTVSPITGTGVPTGVVTLYSGSIPLVTLPLVAGSASYSTTDLPAGVLAIVALYSGDSNYSASTTTLSQTVNQIATTTTLTSSSLTATVFTPVTFTAHVLAGAVPATGSVTFVDGTTLLGISILDGTGTATLTTSSLSVGNHAITAFYFASQNYAQSTASLIETIIPASTVSAILSSTPNPSQPGEQVAITASVTSPNGTPTGSVSFFDGATLLSTQTLNNGLAVLNTSALAPGSHALTISYSGATNFSASTSGNYTQVVNAPLAVTTTALSSSVNPSFAGQSVTLTATVSSVSPGTPTGTMAFYDGTTLIGTQVMTSGSASMSIAGLALGTHSITAVYSGDGTFASSTSSALSQVVQQGTTSTSLNASINPTQFGQPTLLTATIAVTGGTGTPTGTISFFDGATPLGTVGVNSGSASLSVANLSTGTHSLTALYSGDSLFGGSTSSVYSQGVSAATTVTTVSSTPNPANLSEMVTFTASVQVPVGAGVPTGSVTFFDGATALGTSTLTAGLATLTNSSLTLGVHAITATYNGDANFATSMSVVYSQSIVQEETSTTMTSSLNPSMFGQSISLTATVSTGASPTPATGTVTFYDGPFALGTVALSGGAASLSVSNLIVDSHPLSAVYNGDGNYVASTSPLYIQYVIPATTATVISASANPVLFGDPVTFTATVSPTVGSGVPLGLVSFREGSKILGSTPVVGGVATFTTADLSPGGHVISAIYLGNPDFRSSISAPITQTIDQGTTTTALVSSVNPSMFGESVILSATISVATGTGTPGGSVTFYDGATVIGIGNISGNQASIFASNFSVGSHSLTAVYSGDVNFTTSTSPILTQVVTQATSQIDLLSAIPNPSVFGTNVTFFAAVSGAAGLPTGTATFYDGATPIGTANVQEGIVIFNINSLAVGSHTITAVYNGDTNFSSSTSGPLVQQVNQINITVTTLINLTSSLNPSNFGETVTFDVSVTPLAGPGTPTGVVTLYSGADPLVNLTLVNGSASYTTANLPAGVLTIVALYSGDANFSASTTTIPQTVNPLATTMALTSLENPAFVFDSVTFVAQVTVISNAIPSGTVSFYDGTTLLGTFLLNNSGQASLTTSSLAVGSHAISAVYNATQNFVTSSDSLTQVINPAPTSSLLFSSSPNPSEQNESVTFNAVVSSPNGTPPGTVNFFDGATLIATKPLYNGLAVFTTSLLTPGSHTISFTYGGATNFGSSTSNDYMQDVNQPLSFTILSSTLNPSAFNQSINLIATVSGGTNPAVPTGSVTFYDGPNALGTVSLTAGSATFSVSNFTATTHVLTAVYGGDLTYASSSSPLYTQYVNPVATSTALAASLDPTVYGNAVTFTATVSAQVGTGIPAGLVSFYDGEVFLGTGTLSGGTATFTTAELSPGAHTISALYQGNLTFLTSTSSSLTQNVQQGATSSVLVSALNPSTFGESVILTAAVSIDSGSGVLSGTVTFLDGATVIGIEQLVNGVATLETANLAVGTHSLSAVYGGDANFTGSTAPVLTQVVNQAVSQTDLLFNVPNPSAFGTNVTFFATVSSASGTPTGNVTFLDGAAPIGTVAIQNGIAVLDISSLAEGSHTITAEYAGDTNYASSTSDPVVQTVNQINITVTTVTTLTSSLNPSNFGDAVTFDVSVAPLAGPGTPSGVVTLYFGATPLANLTLVNGTASYTTANLPAGVLALVALYSGDLNFSASTTTLNQTVHAIGTTVALSSLLNPASVFDPVTFVAQVTLASGEIPVGTISFFDGATLLGTSILDGSGQANLTTSALTTGSHTISSVYNTTEDFVESSDSLVQVINPAATSSLIFSSSPNPSELNEAVTFTAVLSSSNGVPSGSVSFYDGTTLIGTQPLYTGVAVLTTTALASGTHAIYFVYEGSTDFSPSTSNTYTQDVNKPTTRTTLSSTFNPSSFGQSIDLTATVTTGTNPTAATGSVTFYDGPTVLGTVGLTGGTAIFSTSALSVSAHALTAVYSGDATYSGSASSIYTQYVNAANTSCSLLSSVNPTLYGSPVTFTATVSASVGTVTPTGLVSFYDGTAFLGTGTLSGGVATLTTSALAPAAHSISAVYQGNATFLTSTSPTLTQDVQQGTSSTLLSSSLNPAQFGENVVLTATVSVANGVGTLSGSVTFVEGAVIIGTGTLANGVATVSTSGLSVGVHPITAIYSGDANFVGSTSALLNQTINVAGSVTHILSSTPNPSMLTQAVTFFATVTTGTGSPGGTVSFFDGSTLLGTAPMYEGLAIYETTVLSVGSHLITAQYNGGSNISPSTSTPLTQFVVQNADTLTSVTTITSTPNPSNYGQNVTFDIAVAALAGPGIPTGTVTLYSNLSPLVALPLVNGTASYSTADLPAGLSTMVALYSGDSAFSGSTAALSQEVLPIVTALALSSSSNETPATTPVTFTAHVTAGLQNVSGGTVSFYADTALLGTTFLNSGGLATLTVSNLSIGTHLISAVFNGSQNYLSSSDSIQQVVSVSATSTMILFSSPNPSKPGENVTFFASVAAADGIPTGIVEFYRNGSLLGSTTLFNGLAVFSTSALPIGTDAIIAKYLGSAGFTSSTSLEYRQVVELSLLNTRMSLSTTKNPAKEGTKVTFRASVSSERGTPTGTVTFFNGTHALGTSLLVDGKATLSTASLAVGKHCISALYSGDSKYDACSSKGIVEVVVSSCFPMPPQDFHGSQSEDGKLYLNYLSWEAPIIPEGVVKYEIYRNAKLTDLAVTVSKQPFEFEEAVTNRLQNTYYIVSVDSKGHRSEAVRAVAMPVRLQCVH